jgi:hypothetical protein
MAKIKKAQIGTKMVPSEMKPGTMIKKADRDARATKMADALDKQAGKGKYAPKPSKPKAKAKDGKEMIKRADGSYSQRGLWDNLRSKAAKNKTTGAKPKAPTKAMLSQEKKIKAKGK